jgi:nucleoside-diphosphate-sugar epimerase
MRVLVTGGCGYKGSVLVPKLLAAGHEVRVFDTQWFGNHLQPHARLVLMKGDIRGSVPEVGWAEAIIHLAGIANDPCGELDSKLTWEVNVLATQRLADSAARAGVKQFIFASSASVYGIKDDVPVDEEVEMEPVSDYNKTKMCAERILLSYAHAMAIQLVRPATICGLSPRMRLDTTVNKLTLQALESGAITVDCGEHGAHLMRPNTHIEDITDLYLWMLDRPHLTGAWNAGFENISSVETARRIAEAMTEPVKITITKTKDKRSYAVDSSKLLAAGFRPKRTVNDAITEIVVAVGEGRFKRDESCINLHWMRKHGLVSEIVGAYERRVMAAA